MKKKLVSLLIATGLVLTLIGCGKEEETAPAPVAVEESAEETEEVAEVEEVEEIADVEEAEEITEEDVFNTIEEYYSVEENYNELMDTIQAVFDESGDVYSDISFNILGNTITYSYYFSDYVDDPDALEEYIYSFFDELTDDDWTDMREDVVRYSGVTDDVTVVYEYYNPDEELLTSYEAIIPEM